jgi:type IV pilus assembly protein PilA
LIIGKNVPSGISYDFLSGNTLDFLTPEESMMKWNAKRLRQHGQGMTEYIIIVALIAVAAIAVYQLFGATVRNQTAGVAMEVAGGNGQPAIDKAKAAATKATTVAADAQKNSLSTYGNQAEAGQQ